MRDELGSSFEAEQDIISLFDHVNIVRMVPLEGRLGPSKKRKFALELSKLGSLFEYVYITKSSFPPEVSRYYALQMLCGLEEVHSEGLIHLDFKLDNLLLFGEGATLKLSDFGSAIRLKHSQKQKTKIITGTDVYMAPEMLKLCKINQKVDIFAFGVALYILLVGNYPFKKASITDKEYRWLILRKPAKFRKIMQSKMPGDLSTDGALLDLLLACWAFNPDQRPSTSEIREHEWFK